MATSTNDKPSTVACCPDLAPDDVCDELDFFYRLTSWTTVAGRPGTVAPAPIPVEVKLHFHLKRCRGPLALGDLPKGQWRELGEAEVALLAPRA